MEEPEFCHVGLPPILTLQGVYKVLVQLQTQITSDQEMIETKFKVY